MSIPAELADEIRARIAITDLVNRYADLMDSKRWERFDEFFTDDATARWTPERSMTGRSAIVDAMRGRLGTDEIVTHHHVANFSPVIHGDTAEADVRIRAMHNGVGPRAGRFYESLGTQVNRFVRTPQGWRCNYYEWQVAVQLGSMDVFESLAS